MKLIINPPDKSEGNSNVIDIKKPINNKEVKTKETD